MEEAIKKSKILIVDDTEDNLLFLKQVFSRKGFTNATTIQDSRQVLEHVQQEEPDIILLDLMMPYMDGYEILGALTDWLDPSVFLPIVVLTANSEKDARTRALNAGAIDFLVKPLDALEVVLRTENHLKTRYLYKEQKNYGLKLEKAVSERTHELNQSYQILQSTNKALDESNIEMVERLAEAAEFRDDDTGRHTYRVGVLSALIATELKLPADRVELLRKAARLHDLGKIGIPDAILLKPGKLTNEEFDDMKKHSEIGAKILSGSGNELLKMAENIALCHHERWDGKGYPRGLSEEAIPIEARIVSVVDVFDALSHERPYKKAWPHEEVIALITEQKNQQFDGQVVEAFLKVIEVKADELELLEAVA